MSIGNIYRENYNNSEIILQKKSRINNSEIEIIEIKGWGHPDKLADDLAETISREYSKFTLKECGAVLHHNFDKLCILGGISEVSYGLGKITSPIRVLVNGRASSVFGDKKLNINELIKNTCKEFFKRRLPLINPIKDLDISLNLSKASSPGRIFSKNITARHCWFTPRSIKDLPEYKKLYANDTSLGTGFFPLSGSENLVKNLCNYLSNNKRKNFPNWLGTDVKIMGQTFFDEMDLTICVPQIASYVNNRYEYVSNLNWLKQDIDDYLKRNSKCKVKFVLNARDKIKTDELYLTAIGSSIESGDEGVVGRGNRINGLITPMRPMNLEGANGKNPVYHVGKVYNVLANHISKELHKKFDCSVVVNLISKTGGDLLSPWKTIIQIDKEDIDEKDVFYKVKKLFLDIPTLTNVVINSSIEELALS